jgi:CheY-like chemotaxis protein
MKTSGTPAVKKILVVDDTEPNRLLLGAILSQTGLQVLFAEDGSSGVELFAAERPDIVIVDQIMPNELGSDAVKRMKLIRLDVIAVLTSALADPADIAALMDSCGADAFLPRPFNADTILQILKKHRII